MRRGVGLGGGGRWGRQGLGDSAGCAGRGLVRGGLGRAANDCRDAAGGDGGGAGRGGRGLFHGGPVRRGLGGGGSERNPSCSGPARSPLPRRRAGRALLPAEPASCTPSSAGAGAASARAVTTPSLALAPPPPPLSCSLPPSIHPPPSPFSISISFIALRALSPSILRCAPLPLYTRTGRFRSLRRAGLRAARVFSLLRRRLPLLCRLLSPSSMCPLLGCLHVSRDPPASLSLSTCFPFRLQHHFSQLSSLSNIYTPQPIASLSLSLLSSLSLPPSLPPSLPLSLPPSLSRAHPPSLSLSLSLPTFL